MHSLTFIFDRPRQHEGARDSLDFGFAQGFKHSETGRRALLASLIIDYLDVMQGTSNPDNFLKDLEVEAIVHSIRVFLKVQQYWVNNKG
jgi:hypothetical protein